MKLRQLYEARDEELMARNYNKLVEHLRAHCKKNLSALAKSQFKLFRGDDARGSYQLEGQKAWFLTPARTAPRVSKSGSNLILAWTQISPEWKNIPRRAFSTSCAFDIDVANDFGNEPYLIIPHDKVKSYAVTADDFNFVTINSAEQLEVMEFSSLVGGAQAEAYELQENDDISDELQEVAHHDGFEIPLDDIHQKSDLELLSAALAEAAELVDGSKRAEREVKQFAPTLFDLIEELAGMTLIQFLSKNITPKALGISTHDNLKEVLVKAASTGRKAEVWFEGPYVSITDRVRGVEELPESIWFQKLVDDVNSA